MAHAHPSPSRSIYNDENNQHSNSLRPRPLFHHNVPSPSHSPPAIDPARDDKPAFSLHSRRLQLRNLNFRGSILPSRRLSNQISKWTASSLQTDKSEQKENSSGTTRRRPTPGEDHALSPSSSGSILQEINNSSRRLRHSYSHRPHVADLFDDSPPDESPQQDTPTSWYQEASNNSTPIALDSASDPSTMKQRNLNYPAKSPPPLSSPLAKQIRGRKKSRMNLRSASYEQSKYIEHLESQLAQAEEKIDSLMSPSTTTGRVGKLRTITAENNCLKQELAAWDEKFDERVEDAVGKKVELESSLKGHIRSLEQEIESRNRKIKELEWELERASLRLIDMDSIEATNRSLERRVDVLTELLAQSPTRPTHPLERTSPFRLKTPRPKSMMPRLPSSTEPTALSRTQSTTYSESPTNIFPSGDNSPTLRMATDDMRAEFVPHKKMLSEEMGSLDSGLGESCSVGSGMYSGSRPVSIMSDSSTSPSAWGLPLPGLTSPEMRSRRAARSRKMRKFPSGSNSLKPLILPTASAASAAMSIPASAPILPTHATPSRDISGSSIDPTTSFLSKRSYDSLFDTPTARRRSTTWADNDTLRVLEGNYQPLRQMDSLDGVLSSQDLTAVNSSPARTLSESIESHLDDNYASSPPPDAVEFSFEEEIEEYLQERRLKEEGRSELMSLGEETAPEAVNMELDDNILEDTNLTADSPKEEPSSFTEFASITNPPETPDSNTIRRRRTSSNRDITPMSRARPQTPPAKSPPIASLAQTTVFGSISRYTSYVNEIRRNPSALVRRVIVNAWCSNWSRFGRLSWWVLGLFLGPCVREDSLHRPQPKPADEEFNWHYYSADASRARRAGSAEEGTTRPDESRPKQAKKVTFTTDTLGGGRSKVKCNECVESSLGRSLRLWAKFSFALVLAVGVAVKDGPEKLLQPQQQEQERISPPSSTRSICNSPTSSDTLAAGEELQQADAGVEAQDQEGAWGTKLTWIQNLSVGDFEDS
jgi:hypothetical protein